MSPYIVEQQYLAFRLSAGRAAVLACPESDETLASLEQADWAAQTRFMDELRTAVRG